MFFSDFISSRIRMTNEPELEEFGSEMPLTVSHTPSCVVFQSIWEQTPTLHCSGFQGSSLGISPRGQQLVTLCAATPHSQLPKDLNPRASSLYTRVTNCPSFPRTGSVFLFVFLIVWPCRMACGILVPRPGIEPMPPALEAWSLNHWTTREVP